MFQAIRRAQPARLYVSADGPRSGRDGEAERCAEVRRIASEVDWPCTLHTRFLDHNLGCKNGVSSGISWFFQQESEGIVLEDDVLPVDGFFAWCKELLQRYRDDPRVGLIAGCNHVADHYTPPHSYMFTRHSHVWGWASWRRAWQHYDVQMRSWPQWRHSGGLLRATGGDACVADYWRGVFDRMHGRRADTWDYQWLYTLWSQDLLSVLPAHNLVHNLGIGADATHAVDSVAPYIANNPPREPAMPLRHPPAVQRDAAADRAIWHHVTGLTPLRCAKRTPARWLRALRDRFQGPPPADHG